MGRSACAKLVSKFRPSSSHTHTLSPLRLSMLPLARSSWTKRLITSDDYAAVQINIGDVDPVTGKYKGTFKTFALCGYIRDKVSREGWRTCHQRLVGRKTSPSRASRPCGHTWHLRATVRP
jgi:hypothetical protein